MSYTTLQNIETCPLRWGLRQGDYTDIWSGKGYPPAPAGATLAGHVVHVALERIVRAGAETRAIQTGDHEDSHSDPAAVIVTALRSIGGISTVLDGVFQETVSEWQLNPRLRPRAKELANELQRQLPSLRPRVQHFLNHIDVGGLRSERELSGLSVSDGGNRPERPRRTLAPGLHAEVSLVSEDLGWYGKADLLLVRGETGSGEGDEIVDFKTGLPKPDHALQLRIYALLWARDVRRNPAGHRARKLTVLYSGGPTDVPAPITDEELNGIEQALMERTTRARAAVQQDPPPARPSCEACEWCDVRHMCPAYWMPSTRAELAPSPSQSKQQVDAGVQIVQGQGVWSWLATVREIGAISCEITVGSRVLLRARPHDEHFVSLMAAGRRLRIVGAQFVPPSDESGDLPVLSLTRSTEAFLQSSR